MGVHVNKTIGLGLAFILLICFGGCKSKNNKAGDGMRDKVRQFAATPVGYDETLLDDREKVVIEKLYRASKVIDEIFLNQVYDQNITIRDSLKRQTDEHSKMLYDYFTIMFGPFDRLDQNKPFLGSEPKPAGANFYPAGMSKAEFENWILQHPEDKQDFISEFTVIRRSADKLIAIPYSEFYKNQLELVSRYLLEAADYCDNPSLKKYLLSRAAAFTTNDYYESDVAWMDLRDHKIEVVIGPYEVYEDELFNYKASFECFVTIKDPQESSRLEELVRYLPELEQNLPLPEKYKIHRRGQESPMVVVQLVFSAGDGKAGVQTLAFNLPNDERVRQAKGSKKVMLKNMHEAKFNNQLYPIAQLVMDPAQLAAVTFDAFFKHTLLHEISHGMGPGLIMMDGRMTEAKKELKETYSRIEECKADVLGMVNAAYLIEKGIYPPAAATQMYVTFLAGVFRSVRFGIDEAHGAGTAIIYNYLLEQGGYEYDPQSQKVKVNFERIGRAVRNLAGELLNIEARGDYQGAKTLIEKYAINSTSLALLTGKLAHLPVDIRPLFEIEDRIAAK
jgi:hypothetical protein